MTRRWLLLVLAALVLPSCKAAAQATAPYASEAEMVEFIDKTPTFKGKELTFRMNFDGNARDLLRDKVGGSASFYAIPKAARLNMSVDIPDKLSVPNATYSDQVIVKFRCNEGSMTMGNVAVSIARLQ